MVTEGALPLVRRARADQDIGEALDRRLGESAPAAEGFVDAPERAIAHIRRAPATGSPRWAHARNLPRLRSWHVHRYPCILFYLLRADRIEIWRVLDGKCDIPAWLNDDNESGSLTGLERNAGNGLLLGMH